MRRFLYAVLAGLFFLSAVPVFADGNPDDLEAVTASSSFTPGGNPEQIIESDSTEQSEINNSALTYAISVPDGFDLLNAGDATLYVFNSDTSVMTTLTLPEKNGYHATGYFPAGEHYVISGMIFANTDIQSAFTMPDPDFTLSPDQPFTFTSEPADNSIEKSIEIQKQTVEMQNEVKADRERLISEGVYSESGTDLSIRQESVSDSAFGYQPVEKSDTENTQVSGISAEHIGVAAAGIGIAAAIVIVVVMIRKKKRM